MKRLLGTAIALALAAPMFAYAAEGYLVADISLQSGPDSEYPPITDLASGTPVEVEGCIEGYSWCDVIVGEDRGWVPGSYIEEEYDNQPVFLVDYGPRIGIPVVSFSIGSYWDAHYHNRPFYSQRSVWVNRHFTPRRPQRPSIAHAPPIPNRGGGRPTEVGHAPPAGHAQPRTTTATHTPPPRPTTTTTEHRTAVTDRGQHPKVETAHTDTTRTDTTHRTTTTEHATNAAPKTPVNRAPPKPRETPKAPPKEEKKPPEHKDDDHGH